MASMHDAVMEAVPYTSPAQIDRATATVRRHSPPAAHAELIAMLGLDGTPVVVKHTKAGSK